MSGVVSAEEEAGYLDLGGVQLTPTLKTGMAHDDNVYRATTDKRSSEVLTINPSLELKAISGLNEYSVLLDAINQQYFSVQDANYTDLVINGKVHHEFTSRHRLDLDLIAGNLHDANGQDGDGRPPEYDRAAANFVYGFGREVAKAHIDVFGGIDTKDYKQVISEATGEDKDSTAKRIGSTFFYRVMPRTRVLLEAGKRDLTYDNLNNASFEITSYLAGINWDATAKTSGYAKIGRRYRETGVSGQDSESYGAWEIGISYQLRPYSLIQLSTNRDYGLEADDPEEAGFTSGKNVQISWKHDWSDLINTEISWINRDEEVQSGSGQVLKERIANTVELAANWKIRRWLTLSAGYSYEMRDEDVSAAGIADDQDDQDYRRNVYSVSAAITL